MNDLSFKELAVVKEQNSVTSQLQEELFYYKQLGMREPALKTEAAIVAYALNKMELSLYYGVYEPYIGYALSRVTVEGEEPLMQRNRIGWDTIQVTLAIFKEIPLRKWKRRIPLETLRKFPDDIQNNGVILEAVQSIDPILVYSLLCIPKTVGQRFDDLRVGKANFMPHAKYYAGIVEWE